MFVAIIGWNYEGFNILGVFSSRQNAIDCLNKEGNAECGDYAHVCKYEIDESLTMFSTADKEKIVYTCGEE